MANEPPEGCEPVQEPRSPALEWFHLLRARMGRERAAMMVAIAAVSVAALFIVVIPVITGQMG